MFSLLLCFVYFSHALAGPIILGGAVTSIGGLITNGISISNECLSTLSSLPRNTSNIESNCLNIPGLLQILKTPSNQSIIPAITGFIGSFCSEQSCNDSSALQATLDSIATACDIPLNSSLGSTSSSGSGSGSGSGSTSGDLDVGSDSDPRIGQILGSLIGQNLQNGATNSFNNWLVGTYQPVRDAVCLADTNNDQNCVIETLTNFETIINKPLTLSNTFSLSLTSAQRIGGTSISDLLCTNCMRALSTRRAIVGSVFLPTPARDLFLSLCNTSFIVGKPSGVATEFSSTATQASPTDILPSDFDPSATLTESDGDLGPTGGVGLDLGTASAPDSAPTILTGGEIASAQVPNLGGVWLVGILVFSMLLSGPL